MWHIRPFQIHSVLSLQIAPTQEFDFVVQDSENALEISENTIFSDYDGYPTY